MIAPGEVTDRLLRTHEVGDVRRRINDASSVDELTAIWAEVDAAGKWNVGLTVLAATRKKALLEGGTNPTQAQLEAVA
jgi:hypothetical protein